MIGRFALLIVIFISTQSYCQILSWGNSNNSTNSTKENYLTFVSEKGFEEDENNDKKNAVKINLASLLLNNYSIAVERKINDKFSMQIGYRYQPYKKLSRSIIGNKIAKMQDDGENTIIKDFENYFTGNYAFTAEARFYTKKNSKGFFIGVYGRYARFDVDNIDLKFQEFYPIPISINANGIGGGISLGRKYLIGKRLLFEFNILGGHFGKLNGTLTGQSYYSDFSEAQKQQLKYDIESQFTLQNRKFVTINTVDESIIKGEVNGPFIGIRGDICIGF